MDARVSVTPAAAVSVNRRWQSRGAVRGGAHGDPAAAPMALSAGVLGGVLDGCRMWCQGLGSSARSPPDDPSNMTVGSGCDATLDGVYTRRHRLEGLREGGCITLLKSDLQVYRVMCTPPWCLREGVYTPVSAGQGDDSVNRWSPGAKTVRQHKGV